MKNVVLMYHDVYESDPLDSGFRRERDLPYKLSLDKFKNQVKNICEFCENNNVSKDSVVFTFDDGGCSFYHLIADVLEEYGYKGHFYITTQYIDTEGFLTKQEIRSLEERGHIIGSHAHSHEHLYKLSSEQVRMEWMNSVSILSDILGHTVTEASIPNGDSSETVLRCAYECGLRDVYTSKPTTKISSYRDMNLYGRYVVLSDTSTEYLLSIIGSPFTRMKLSLKWSLIYCIKKVLGDRYVQLKNIIYRNK